MSTYGIIADVHGNLEALSAVLAALGRCRVDKVVCLGDLVGYNGESNECVELIGSRNIEAIAGNHDLIALGLLGTDRCAMRPAYTLKRTRTALAEATRRSLSALPRTRLYEERIALVHGGVDDVCEYMTTPTRISENASRLTMLHPEAPPVLLRPHPRAQAVRADRRGVAGAPGTARGRRAGAPRSPELREPRVGGRRPPHLQAGGVRGVRLHPLDHRLSPRALRPREGRAQRRREKASA
jgi:predicted phosphodiesterase